MRNLPCQLCFRDLSIVNMMQNRKEFSELIGPPKSPYKSLNIQVQIVQKASKMCTDTFPLFCYISTKNKFKSFFFLTITQKGSLCFLGSKFCERTNSVIYQLNRNKNNERRSLIPSTSELDIQISMIIILTQKYFEALEEYVSPLNTIVN